MRLARILTFTSTLVACAPNPAAPVKTAAVRFDPKAQKYGIAQVELDTLTDLVTLQGSVAKIVGGASITLDANDPALQNAKSEGDLRKALLKDPGGPVRASFISSGGVQWPADFHSENMVTTYYNFERAFDFYQSLGLTLAQVGTPTVYYFPHFVDTSISADPIQDNAAFFAPLGAFLVLPFDKDQDIPLPMNLGIIGHEYSHFMVNARVYDHQGIPQVWLDWGAGQTGVPTPALNLLKSLDEGFADLFGTGVTCGPDFAGCDPNFIAASIPAAATPRNLSGVHCYDQTLASELQTQDVNAFIGASHQYEVGTVLASSVWRAAGDPAVAGALGQAEALRQVMQTVYDALDDPNPDNPGLKQDLVQLHGSPALFTVDFILADTVVRHATSAALGAALCDAFFDRLGSRPCTQQDLTQARGGTAPGCIAACSAYPTAAYGECSR